MAQGTGIQGITPVLTLERAEAARGAGRAVVVPGTELAEEVTIATVQVTAAPAVVAPETVRHQRNHPIESLRLAPRTTQKGVASL